MMPDSAQNLPAPPRFQPIAPLPLPTFNSMPGPAGDPTLHQTIHHLNEEVDRLKKENMQVSATLLFVFESQKEFCKKKFFFRFLMPWSQ